MLKHINPFCVQHIYCRASCKTLIVSLIFSQWEAKFEDVGDHFWQEALTTPPS